MLLPGHLAGGYLATLGLLQIFPGALTAEQIRSLLIIGTIAGAIPDWDHIVTFIQTRTLQLPKDEGHSHRNLFTHTPIFWLVVSFIIYLFTKNGSFGPYLALTVLASSWSHFFLDTFIHGIRWLWPLSNQKFAFLDLNVRPEYNEPRFFSYWIKFVKWYTQFICFYLEIFLTTIAILIFIYK